MWTKIYDRYGRILSDAAPHFRDQLHKEHQPVIMVEMLEPDLVSKGKFILSSAVRAEESNNFENVLTDGNIDIDYDRGTRRTAELTILNASAEFTPTTAGFESDGPWEGLLYINRVVRIWRGIKTFAGEMYVPVGTFFVDGAEVIVEENMSIVNLVLSDFYKKLAKSYFGVNKKWERGTNKNAIIRDLLDGAGVPRTGKYAAIIDPLDDRDTPGRVIGSNIKIDRGTSRGDALKNLAKDWNIDVYFDPLGVFRSEDRKSDRDKKIVWTFESKEVGKSERNGMLVSITRSFNDDNLYNHVILIGTGNEKNTVTATRRVTNSASKFHEDKIGDRVFFKESDKWRTQSDVDEAMQRIWAKRIQFSESINAETICNPMLEADDKVKFTERDKAKLDDAYRIRRFNVPLVTSKQTIEATNIIRDDDIWG